MKQILTILAFLAISVSASAQYNTTLYRKGGNLYQDDTKLSREQIDRMLSPFHNGNGTAYNDLWNSGKGMRTSGIVLTSVGTVSAVVGPIMFIVGFAQVIGSGIGSGISGNPDGIVGEGTFITGTVLTCASSVMLVTGIPLWCVGSKRMKNVVKEYNGQVAPKDLTIAFGPCPSGVGLSLRF